MRQQTILVIEDEADISELVTFNLNKEGFRVLTASDGESGLKEAFVASPALVLLDLALPGMQGLEVCRHLRNNPKTSLTPIVILTARSEEVDIILGLEVGADDYIAKPFRIRELVARVRAVLRRSSRTDPLTIGRVPFQVDPSEHTVVTPHSSIHLTPAEFRILQCLTESPGRVLSRDQLLHAITEGKSIIVVRNVDVHIRALRRKLREFSTLIETVRGVGYKFSSSAQCSPREVDATAGTDRGERFKRLDAPQGSNCQNLQERD